MSSTYALTAAAVAGQRCGTTASPRHWHSAASRARWRSDIAKSVDWRTCVQGVTRIQALYRRHIIRRRLRAAHSLRRRQRAKRILQVRLRPCVRPCVRVADAARPTPRAAAERCPRADAVQSLLAHTTRRGAAAGA